MRKVTLGSFCIAMLISSLFVINQNPVHAASNKEVVINPYVVIGEPGWFFRNTTKLGSMVFFNAVSGRHYINATGSTMTYTSTVETSITVGGESSASLEGGWGPISATIGYTANQSFTINQSDSASITIRPHYEGWIDYGTKKDTWTGTYGYVDMYGNESKVVNITVKSPRVEAAMAKEVYAYY